MAAYLYTSVDGNKSFGGYLSVDGEKAFEIQDDMTYELAPGRHHMVVYSTSNIQRANAKVQAFTYNTTSSNGAFADAMHRSYIAK
jgi:hypothetical protein